MDKRPDAGIDGCICLRDMMRIFCEACGHAYEGNFKTTYLVLSFSITVQGRRNWVGTGALAHPIF